ncbi:MAG: LysM peptidoglycan-binding domain-containing protein [Clostridia bacterium]|nr:LysM peptidoglycan-binding domain-containing protein [Clostridia bacterium]
MKKTTSLALTAFTLIMLLSVGASAATHTVTRGDTLWGISRQYGVKFSDILSLNTHLKDPNLIYPGDTVYLPADDAAKDTDSKLVSSFEEEVCRLVNDIRRKNGLTELKISADLCRVARIKSKDMHDAGYFSHISPSYGSPFDMMRNYGIQYKTAGENIARGYSTPKAVVDGWMNSKGHRENILNKTYTEIGVGHYENGNYWTQMFVGK